MYHSAMDTDQIHKQITDMLGNAEAMAHPVIGPCLRQLSRVLHVKLKSMMLETQFAHVVSDPASLTPDEAREVCEEARALCIESAGAYGALTKLLPAMIEEAHKRAQ